MKKRLLSLCMVLALCLSLLPTAAFAGDGGQNEETTDPYEETTGLCEHHTRHEVDSCGYDPATAGSVCNYVCEICKGSAEQESCICSTRCTESRSNPDCPVCNADSADLSACTGTESPPQPPSQNQNTVYLEAEMRAAIQNAGNTPTTIELGGDIVIQNTTEDPGEPFEIGPGQNITVNFNGFTIDVDNNVNAALKYLIQNAGTVALVGPGSIKSRGVFNKAGGVMTVDGITINVAGEGCIGIENAGTLTLTDSYITSEQRSYRNKAPIAIEVDGGSVTVNSGTFDYSIQKTEAASNVQILVKSAVFKPETNEEQDMKILTFPEGTVEVQVVVWGKTTYTKLGPEEDVLQYLLQVQDKEQFLKKFAVISGDINLTSLKADLEVGNNGYGRVWISDVDGEPMLVPHSQGPTEFFTTGPPLAIFADPAVIDFGIIRQGSAIPQARTVKIISSESITLVQPASANFEVGSLTKTELQAYETATFTIQPKAGLGSGTYKETIVLSGTTEEREKVVSTNVTVKFSVQRRWSSTAKTPSQLAIEKIRAARPGDIVEITLITGNTKLDKEVFEELLGKDITLKVNLSGGVNWMVYGKDISENATLNDIDMGVSMNISSIPVDLINLVTGELGTVQMTLLHNGPFGFTMTLTVPLDEEKKGLWANLYHYDSTGNRMHFETADQVDEEGNVSLSLTHASEYALVLDTKSHELPFEDVGANDWYTEAVEYVYRQDIMTGTGAATFDANTSLSRAMVAQILYNLEDRPAVAGESTFADVSGHWAADAIAWAQENGVVNGYGENNTFRPNQAVTREELAQMLYNYAQYKEIFLPASGDLSKFPDGNKVSSWARPAMSWATGLQVINGYEDNTLRPGGTTTRAEAASMIMELATTLIK